MTIYSGIHNIPVDQIDLPNDLLLILDCKFFVHSPFAVESEIMYIVSKETMPLFHC